MGPRARDWLCLWDGWVAEAPLHERIAARALDYVSNPPAGDDPVMAHADPVALAAAFDASVGLGLGSGQAHGDDDVLAAVEQVLAWSTHTTHPRFMNQNFAGADPVAVVGDWVGAALNTTNATYEVAPVFTLMERAVLSRLAELAGFGGALPGGAGPAPGLFCAGGSMAGLMALQLARHRRDPDMVTQGSGPERLAIFISASGHYSAAKNAALLGLGTDAVVEVAVDASGAMVPEALAEAVRETREGGRVPLAVIATAGTTVTAAYDPLEPIVELCSTEDLWMHVDAAYGGSALFSPTESHRLAGLGRSDSMAWNLHKMLGMTQQCSVLLVREPERLGECFATGADYLFQPDKQHGDLDAGDATVMCGRRVDVLKLWLAWKSHGDAGFAARVDHAVALADHARRRITAGDGSLATVVAGDFTNVCFLWVPPELRPFELAALSAAEHARLHALAPAVKAQMLADGSAMLGYQPVHGINCFRLIVMNPGVAIADVDAILDLITRHAAACWG